MKKLIFAVLSFILVACSNQSIEEGLDDLNARLVELEQQLAAVDANALISDINDIIAQVETIEQINEENKQAIAEAMATLTDLHDQLAAILVQIQEAATVEQLQAINEKVQSISEGISMLVFVADYDYDGVMNGLDQCPDTPITEISQVNGVGCSPSQLGG
jgi:ABC-type transporter Mla subunit MlaD